MKSKQLLSVVFSLIMFTGMTAGSVAFADSDDLEDQLEDFCEMSEDEKELFFEDHPRIAKFKDRLTDFCELDEDKQEEAIKNFIKEHVPEARDHDDYDHEDKLDRYCEMTDEEKDYFISMYDKGEDHLAKMDAYCELDEDQRDAYLDELKDGYKMHSAKDMRDILERYCEMSDEDKRAFLAEHYKNTDHAEKMDRYCELDEDERMDFIEEHRDEYKSHMKDKMSDYKKEYKMLVNEMKDKHKDVRDRQYYDRFCEMSDDERALAIDDLEKLEKISEWCYMTPEERDDFKKEHHDIAMEFKE